MICRVNKIHVSLSEYIFAFIDQKHLLPVTGQGHRGKVRCSQKGQRNKGAMPCPVLVNVCADFAGCDI